jgi:ABC-2 type transport system permease protein
LNGLFERTALLVTPTTDSEILLGKGIAAFLPPIGAILGGATIFMVLMDMVTQGTLGYYFFPNWDSVIVLFLMVPCSYEECRMERHHLCSGE